MKKIVLATVLTLLALQTNAETSIVRLKGKPSFSEEGVVLNTNKGEQIFYTLPWFDDKNKERNFKVLETAKRGQCLKITTLSQDDGDVLIRKVSCRK